MFALAVLVVGCTQSQPTEFADTVYTNGKIYTVNEAQPWAEAVGVKDGKLIFVGSAADAEGIKGKSKCVVGPGGSCVKPGIFDLHTHHFIAP